MKTIRYFILMAAASALGACSSSDSLGSGYSGDPSAVVLKAKVGAIITSRSNPLGQAGETTTAFHSGDIVAVSNDGGANFLTYTLGPDASTWTPESGKYLTWNDNNSMSFKAYYPAGKNNASMTGFTIPTHQTEYHTGTANDIALADYMTSEGNFSKPDQGNAVTLAFVRNTARVIVKIDQLRNEFGTTPPTIENVRIKGKIDMEGIISDVTSYTQEVAGVTGSTYTALLLPTDKDSKASFITLTVNGKELTVTGIPALEAGKSYTFNLTVGRNALTLTSVQVSDWQTGSILNGGETIVTGRPLILSETTTLTNDIINNAISDDGSLVIYGGMTDAQKQMIFDFVNGHSAVKHLNMDRVTSTMMNYWGNYSLTSTSLVSVALPTYVTNIDGLFQSCTALTTVTGLDNVTSATNNAFKDCTSLKEVSMPKLSVLSDRLFYSCTSLTKVSLNGATNLIPDLFYPFLDSLKEIYLTSPTFTDVASSSFRSISDGRVTLYLNANQKNNITVSGNTCNWKPLGIDVDLSRFAAVYCGTELVYKHS